MNEFLDRVQLDANKIKLTPVDNEPNTYTMEKVGEVVVEGTPINRENMMAVQGFSGNNIVFNEDGSITETNEDGHTLTTVFTENTIVETFVGEKTITKTTTFNDDGSISEVIS